MLFDVVDVGFFINMVTRVLFKISDLYFAFSIKKECRYEFCAGQIFLNLIKFIEKY